jgi:hypothetical protein
MKRPILLLCCWAAAIAGCSNGGPNVQAEAEALVQQGKLEEAAARVDLICAFTPDGDPCRASDLRAAELRIQAAEKALGEGRFARAERLFIRALATTDAKAAESAAQRLASEDLKQGLAYERALGGSDKQAVMKTMEAVLATKTPVAAQAKAWIDRERPGLLAEAVKAACGPAHEGSCSKAAAELEAAGAGGPEVEGARAIASLEERRIHPLRLNAETLLNNFAARTKNTKLARECLAKETAGGEPSPECANYDVNLAVLEYVVVRFEARNRNENVWRKAMAAIADPELIAELETRKKQAIDSGDYEKRDVPRPSPAPKK